jgi:diguanylate cyclase (GGDEF)-like protein
MTALPDEPDRLRTRRLRAAWAAAGLAAALALGPALAAPAVPAPSRAAAGAPAAAAVAAAPATASGRTPRHAPGARDNRLYYLTQLAQALGAFVLAAVLHGFYRTYRRRYLLDWSWSWWAGCLYLCGSGLTLYLVGLVPSIAPFRSLLAAATAAAAYCQVAWLLFGTREVATGRRTGRGRRAAALAAALLLPAVTVTAARFAPEGLGSLLRMCPPVLAVGLAFAGAGTWLLAAPHSAGLGRRLTGVALLLYGGEQLHYLGIVVASHLLRRMVGLRVEALAIFDVPLQAAIGLGMVIWLLDEERKRAVAAARQVEHLAYHDALTGLPNRNLFLAELERRLPRARRAGQEIALLFLDLDRFKLINDSLGHGAGDEMLQTLAARLARGLAPGALLARLGDDEFTLLLPAADEATIAATAERLLAQVRAPIPLEEREVVVTASLGVSRFPGDGADAEELLKRAHTAMYQAKEHGRDRCRLYAPGTDLQALDRLALETDLRKALAKGELTLHYQPLLDARRGEIAGVEALLRWEHPTRGLLCPADFLWLAEATGLSDAVDHWVLATACRQARAWQERFASPPRLAVNLSARPFQRPGLVERVREVLAASGLAARALELEITETLAMADAEASLAVLSGLKELGVRISIDDFGTGYSSLSYLTHFPIDTLKVDGSFVRSLGGTRGSYEIAAAVIALAHTLDIGVVAEGVELESQWLILRELGCDEVQGYLFSPPLPPGESLDRIFCSGSVAGAAASAGAAGGWDGDDRGDGLLLGGLAAPLPRLGGYPSDGK